MPLRPSRLCVGGQFVPTLWREGGGVPCPVSDRRGCPVSGRKGCPASKRRICPVSERRVCPVSERRVCPVSDRRGCPVSGRIGCPASKRRVCPVSERRGCPVSARRGGSNLPFPSLRDLRQLGGRPNTSAQGDSYAAERESGLNAAVKTLAWLAGAPKNSFAYDSFAYDSFAAVEVLV
eukprot:366075-Chlamydomonas_euryale.AAC.6